MTARPLRTAAFSGLRSTFPSAPLTSLIRSRRDPEAIRFAERYRDCHCSNRQGRILLAEGNHACAVAAFGGTMKGRVKMGDRVIPATGKSFHVEFWTVATLNDQGAIAEE